MATGHMCSKRCGFSRASATMGYSVDSLKPNSSANFRHDQSVLSPLQLDPQLMTLCSFACPTASDEGRHVGDSL
jgi:hypothetical protein